MSSWYAVYTHSHSEMKAQINLEQQGFETYYPRFQKQRRHARRLDTIMAPLFPRYIFVKFDMEMDRWRVIHSTIGVKQLVQFGEMPATVPEQIIDDIRTSENERGLIVLNNRAPMIKGDRVQVIRGPMCNNLGLFVEMSDNERVIILIDFLGRKVKTKVPSSFVEAYA